jgi:hypothetical protein
MQIDTEAIALQGCNNLRIQQRHGCSDKPNDFNWAGPSQYWSIHSLSKVFRIFSSEKAKVYSSTLGIAEFQTNIGKYSKIDDL